MMEYTINRPLAFYAPINIHNDAHTLIHISHSHIGIRQICRLNHKQYRHTELNNTIAIKINYAMCLFCQVYSKHTQRQLQLRVCVCVSVCMYLSIVCHHRVEPVPVQPPLSSYEL